MFHTVYDLSTQSSWSDPKPKLGGQRTSKMVKEATKLHRAEGDVWCLQVFFIPLLIWAHLFCICMEVWQHAQNICRLQSLCFGIFPAAVFRLIHLGVNLTIDTVLQYRHMFWTECTARAGPICFRGFLLIAHIQQAGWAMLVLLTPVFLCLFTYCCVDIPYVRQTSMKFLPTDGLYNIQPVGLLSFTETDLTSVENKKISGWHGGAMVSSG